MLVHLFYLSVAWLLPSFVLVLVLGPRLRWGHYLVSVLYLTALVALGDAVAYSFLAAPLSVVLPASLIVLGFGLAGLYRLRDWNAPGQAFFLFSLISTASYLAYAFASAAFSPVSLYTFLFSFLLFLLEAAALSVSLAYAFEVLDVLCRITWRRLAPSIPENAAASAASALPNAHAPTHALTYPPPPTSPLSHLPSTLPFVSLHVPAYNEPPELVEQTLRALAQLDYPNYEVILVDNNTPDESTWRPLEKICRELGFKCLHLDKWPGYKSGALNFALALTDPRAEIIGVIDADYLVQPDYLRQTAPYFADPTLAFVQTPQDYRGYEDSRFSRAAYDGYKYFFAVSMPARNERNAIIFCGTMGLLRKSVLQEIGGWDEWCITEDAEASLRILNKGYQSLYIPQTFGRGLMPLDFEGLKKQRFRWAFGGIQILKKHWHRLMPWANWLEPGSRLTGAQRYFYLASGLQWFNELLTFAFTVMVLVSALLTVLGQTSFLRPSTEAFVILPIVLIGTNMLRALWGLRHALRLSWSRAFFALTLWFGLTWVVALACVQAVVQRRGVFLRTPKAATNAAWARALQATSLETVLGLACVLSGFTALALSPSLLTFGLFTLCLSQSLIYLSAPSHSLLSLAPAGVARQPDRSEIGAGPGAFESRLALQVGLAALIVLVVGFAAALWPASNRTPWWYAYYNPQPLLTPVPRPSAIPTLDLPELFPPQPTLLPPATDGPVDSPTGEPAASATTEPEVSPSAEMPASTATSTAGATSAPSATPPASTATATPPASTPTASPTTSEPVAASATPPPAASPTVPPPTSGATAAPPDPTATP